MKKSMLLKLKKRLPHNFGIILAKETGFSKSYILKVLMGDRINNKILRAATDLANQKKETEEVIKEKINNL